MERMVWMQGYQAMVGSSNHGDVRVREVNRNVYVVNDLLRVVAA